MFLQLTANGIVFGLFVALLSLAFSIQYAAVRFFVFSFAACSATGSYLTYAFHEAITMPGGIVAATAAGATLGLLLEWAIYQPLRSKGAQPLTLMLASIGVYVVAQNSISLLFGDATRSLRPPHTSEGLEIFAVRLAGIQLFTAGASAVLIGAALLVLRYTSLGISLRAVAADRVLARISGVDDVRCTLIATAAASGCAAFAGSLLAIDIGLSPTMGFDALLWAFVGAIVGGLSRPAGAVVGGLCVGTIYQLVPWLLSTRWQDASLFIVLLVILVLRPGGLLNLPTAALTTRGLRERPAESTGD